MLDFARARTARKMFEIITRLAEEDCPGHQYKSPILQQCQQQGLLDKCLVYFEPARSEMMANPIQLGEGFEGDWLKTFLLILTPQALYSGGFYEAKHEVLKDPKKKDVLTKIFEESLEPAKKKRKIKELKN